MTALELIDELWAERPQVCCPYVRHDERGCFCTSPRLLAGGDSYMPCEAVPLQLWCLTREHYPKCCLYPVGDIG
jgi:hypothetical protein